MSAPQSTSPTATAKLLQDFPLFPDSLNNRSHAVRKVTTTIEATKKEEGIGAEVRRSIGIPQLRNLTPFLMLDHFSVAKGAGFPDHPHRGQETITYLLKGAVDHEDFAGHRGTIRAGDLQFMTAGRGIVHAEMPAEESDIPNEGMQLWVDLPEKLKDVEPRYRDLKGSDIPVAKSADESVTVKVISGRSYGVDSFRDLAYTPMWYLDVYAKPGAKYVQHIPPGWTAFIYMLSGSAHVGGQSSHPDESKVSELSTEKTLVDQFHIALLDNAGDEVVAEAPAEGEGAHFILVAGTPLDQPIVQYGPFVVTHEKKVTQALMDYQLHTNGFERADGWQSKIGRPMMR